MGKRGPKPKPTAIKLLEGNPGKRRINRNEPTPVGSAVCPDDFSPEAKAVWDRILGSMPPGFFTAADVGDLRAYCISEELHRKAYRELGDDGHVVLGEKGQPYQSPWVSILNTQARNLATLGTRLGLDPTARNGLKSPDDQKKSKFGGLIGQSPATV